MPTPTPDLTRDEAAARIRKALRSRSGIPWSVTTGRGTAWGWITIDTPPARRTWAYRLPPGCLDRPENYEEYNTNKPGGHMGPEDRKALGILLSLPNPAHHQGVSIPAASDFWREYVDRAEGRTPSKLGSPYWD